MEASNPNPPQETLFHRVVRKHFVEFQAKVRRWGDGAGFIVSAFRKYLDCGDAARGCAEVKCPGCGYECQVPFSCRNRVCPSCAARAMKTGAAKLVGEILPQVPYRHVVVSYPFGWNSRLAFQRKLRSAVQRMVTNVLQDWESERSVDGKCGGALFRHRAGAALELRIHDHGLLFGGVYRKNEDGSLSFQASQDPELEDVKWLAVRLEAEFRALMIEHGVTREEVKDGEEKNDAEQLELLASGKAERARKGTALADPEAGEVEHPTNGLWARVNGLHVFVSARIPAEARGELQKLCGYLLRPGFSVGRLGQRADGMLTYRLEEKDKRGNTVLVLKPVDFMLRVASLMHAPGQHVCRYFGILAGGSADRKKVIPKREVKDCKHEAKEPEIIKEATPTLPIGLTWPEVMRRLTGSTSLKCPKCACRMKPKRLVTEPPPLRRCGPRRDAERARGPPGGAAARALPAV